MEHRSRRTWMLILGTTVAVVLMLAIVWTAAPEGVRGLFLLAGGVFAAVTYVGVYILERRAHW